VPEPWSHLLLKHSLNRVSLATARFEQSPDPNFCHAIDFVGLCHALVAILRPVLLGLRWLTFPDDLSNVRRI
jgi:hypothetical protein